MATYRCLACSGTYITPQPPGIDYYHVCPLIRSPDGHLVQRDGHRDETHGPRRAEGKGRVQVSTLDLPLDGPVEDPAKPHHTAAPA